MQGRFCFHSILKLLVVRVMLEHPGASLEMVVRQCVLVKNSSPSVDGCTASIRLTGVNPRCRSIWDDDIGQLGGTDGLRTEVRLCARKHLVLFVTDRVLRQSLLQRARQPGLVARQLGEKHGSLRRPAAPLAAHSQCRRKQ